MDAEQTLQSAATLTQLSGQFDHSGCHVFGDLAAKLSKGSMKLTAIRKTCQ